MNKLTAWEAGQELVRAYDEVANAAEELQSGGWAEQAKFLTKKAHEIGRLFNEFSSGHSFTLPDGAKKKR